MTKRSFEETLETVEAGNRAEWRNWLENHHAGSQGVWLVFYKVASGKPSVRYEEAVREALCFGWIDSKIQAIDDERYRQMFTPRKQGSAWSAKNKGRVEELIHEGIMTDAGMMAIESARNDGSWTALDSVEALEIPEDLAARFTEHPEAKENYDGFTDSKKKSILSYLLQAKREQTRRARIQRIVEALLDNRTPFS